MIARHPTLFSALYLGTLMAMQLAALAALGGPEAPASSVVDVPPPPVVAPAILVAPAECEAPLAPPTIALRPAAGGRI